MRHDPERESIANYPLAVDIRATFADMDASQHINNIAIARFFEEGRSVLSIEVFGEEFIVHPSVHTSCSEQLLLASVKIDYLRQGRYPGMLRVGIGVSKVGNSSYDVASGLFQENQCIALCDGVTVFAIDGRSHALPTHIRDRLFARQYKMKHLASATEGGS